MAQRLFQERRTYRRYRLMDAARLLPILGTGLFFGPIFILTGDAGIEGQTSSWMIYLFVAWAALIAMAAGLAWALGRALPVDPGAAADGDGVPPLDEIRRRRHGET